MSRGCGGLGIGGQDPGRVLCEGLWAQFREDLWNSGYTVQRGGRAICGETLGTQQRGRSGQSVEDSGNTPGSGSKGLLLKRVYIVGRKRRWCLESSTDYLELQVTTVPVSRKYQKMVYTEL